MTLNTSPPPTHSKALVTCHISCPKMLGRHIRNMSYECEYFALHFKKLIANIHFWSNKVFKRLTGKKGNLWNNLLPFPFRSLSEFYFIFEKLSFCQQEAIVSTWFFLRRRNRRKERRGGKMNACKKTTTNPCQIQR